VSRAPKKQSRRADVPNEQHIARYCNPQRVIRDPITKEILGVQPWAFELRQKLNETYLSTHWMEFFSADSDKQFKAVLAALRVKHRGVVAQAAFVKLNAGAVVQAGAERNHSIRIRDRSSPIDPGYSGIYGMPQDNSDLGLLAWLASECCLEVRGVDAIDALP
jgi:hypothetical protein